MAEYDVKDIKVFVDGVEIVDPAPGGDTGVSPSDEDDKYAPLKNWTGKTKDWRIKNGDDCEGTIALLMSSASNAYLSEVANAKRAVQIAFVSENASATGWSKISADECYFKQPEVKPGEDEPRLNWNFVGTNFQIEF